MPLVRDDLRRLRAPAEVIRLDLIDDGESWLDVRAGDVVTCVLPSVNAVSVVEVLAQTFDLDRGLMTVAGRVVSEFDR